MDTTARPVSVADAAGALRRWAHGDLAAKASVEVVLTTTLLDEVVPDYLDWLADDVAKVDFDRLIADVEGDGPTRLSGSGEVLARVAANLARGARGAGKDVDLRDLWTLDDQNRRAVFKALRDTLLSASNAFHPTTTTT